MSWPLGARQVNYVDRACQVPWLFLRLTFQESSPVVWTSGIVEDIVPLLAIRWIAVTVGSTAELTSLVIRTLKYRLSCFPGPEGLRSGRGYLVTASWALCLPETQGRIGCGGKAILNSAWSPAQERNMLPFQLKFGLWFPGEGVIRSVGISCWGPLKTFHL